tara:strand:+ start:56 stop:1267 length:1212 start_codon:yes stop_codon:yes gene_type:complete
MADIIGPPIKKRNTSTDGLGSFVINDNKIDSTESEALKMTLAAFNLLEEKDQNVAYNIFDGMLKLNVINDNESLAKIKASELAAKKIGYDGDIPVNLDDKTLFKIALDTKNKLPSDIRLKVDTNTNLVGDKELENAKLTAGNFGINFSGETAKGEYNYNNGKLNVKPTVTRTDDNIQTDTNLQYLLDEDTVNIFTPAGPRKIPRESLTVNINTDKLYDEKSGTISYVKRKDDGDEKASVFLNNYLANENELGGAENQAQLSFNYVTDKGIKFSGETYKDFERDANQNQIGVNLPITDYANLEASKSKGDFIDDNNLRLNVGKNFSFGPGGKGGNLNIGGFYDQDGEYQAGINYKLAFGQKPERKGPTFSTTDPQEALSFLQKTFKKGGRVKMFKGGLAGILKV